MAIKPAGRWSPDTCDCVVDFAGDDVHPREVRIHRYTAVQHYAQVPVLRNTADDPEFVDTPGFEHYEYETTETRLVDGPCGADHPNPVIGEVHDGGVFHEHHVVIKQGRGHWNEVSKANVHWNNPALILLAVKAALTIKRYLKLHPAYQLHDKKTDITFRYEQKVLHINCPTLTQEEKTVVQTLVNNKCGDGTVQVT